MQSVRFVVRQIGVPNHPNDVYSAQETAEYLEYQYLSQGYVVHETHYLGEAKGANGSPLPGYTVMLILVKNPQISELVKLASESNADTGVPAEETTTAKRGRPKKENTDA